MSLPHARCCASCAYFYADRPNREGECRRHSPGIGHVGEARWPVVSPGADCGEFSMKYEFLRENNAAMRQEGGAK